MIKVWDIRSHRCLQTIQGAGGHSQFVAGHAVCTGYVSAIMLLLLCGCPIHLSIAVSNMMATYVFRRPAVHVT